MQALHRAALLVVGLTLSGAAAPAGTDKFQITEEEKAACQSDAVALCSATFPDEDLLLTCMRSNMPNLSTGCRKTFKAGLRRRHLL